MSREECYQQCYDDLKALVTAEDDFYSALGNASSILFYALNKLADADAKLDALKVNWVGFYLLHSPQELVLAPFQGKVACQRIKVGKGVCGTSVLFKKHQAVPDVHAVPGHIACDSASESEVVVLIREPSGRIVGLLDIDSTVKGFFSDADIAPLERICTHLGAMLDGRFPLKAVAPQAAGAVMPGAAPLQASKLPTAVPAVELRRPGVAARGPVAPTTVVHNEGHLGSTPKPVTNVVEVRPWEFQSVQLDLMLKSTAFPELENKLGVKMLPEIIFNENRLNFVCPLQGAPQETADGTRPGPRLGIARFLVSAADALEDASKFYGDSDFESIRSAIAVPATAAWDKFRGTMQSFDPQIDWAFRNRYTGTVDFVPVDESTSKPLIRRTVDPATATPAESINWDMLKRTDLPIRFFAALDLFEDDLHDGGLSRLTVKTRAMDTCFFVLLRHVIRVDGTILIVRDVRVFHDMTAAKRTIVFEETEKQVTLAERIAASPGVDSEHLRRQMTREEECLEFMRTTFERRSVVDLPTELPC